MEPRRRAKRIRRGSAATPLALLLAAGAVWGAPAAEFRWMYDLPPAQAVGLTRELGLNTLYLTTSTQVAEVEATRRVVRAAHEAGLQVVLALPTHSAIGRPPDPQDAQYAEEVGARLRAVVRQFHEEPGVTAWAMGDYADTELSYTVAGLQSFLQTRYPGLEALNAAWGSRFTTWPQVTAAAIRELDGGYPWGVGRASVDLADYQAAALRDLLIWWAEQVRELDPDRPLFTGRLALYRSLVAVPEQYDYVIPAVPWDLAEPDVQSHNVQAVDLARQAGAFEVVPSLRVPAPPDAHYAQGVTVGRWLRTAALHGARGVALDGWGRLQAAGAGDHVRETLAEHLQATAGSFRVRPQAALAVLYQPYAEGLAAEGVPLHGYLPGLAPGQPGMLMWALRLGSRFGLVDYLTPERLIEADLEGYSAILAPTALRLPPEAQGRLRRYVERGGRVVLDLGAGMYETGSWVALPADVARMCGITELGELEERAGNLGLFARSALFPSLAPPLTSKGLPEQAGPRLGEQITREGPADQRRNWTLRGPMAMATLSSSARAALISTARPGADREAARFAGLIAHPYGLGWAAFCTGSLWARWDPQCPLFAGVHGELWAPRARYAVDQAGLWPQGVEFCAEPEGITLLNVTDRVQAVTVWAGRAEPEPDPRRGPRLHQGAVNQIFSPLHSEVPPTASVLLRAELPPAALVSLPQLPVRLAALSPQAVVWVAGYTEEELLLELAGAPDSLGLRREAWWALNATRPPAGMQLQVEDGRYPVQPGSRHQVTLDLGEEEPQVRTLEADAEGVLTVPLSAARVTVRIAPAPLSAPSAS